jgi:hypothetical protein
MSTHAPLLPKLSLERMGWPAVECVSLNKDLDQMVLFMWFCEAIAPCDPGQPHLYSLENIEQWLPLLTEMDGHAPDNHGWRHRGIR